MIEIAEIFGMESETEIHAEVLIEARRPFAYASEVQCQISQFEKVNKLIQVQYCQFFVSP